MEEARGCSQGGRIRLPWQRAAARGEGAPLSVPPWGPSPSPGWDEGWGGRAGWEVKGRVPHHLWGVITALKGPVPSQLPVQKARRQQMDMIAELKKRQMVKEPLIYEGKDGAIEDIISGE